MDVTIDISVEYEAWTSLGDLAGLARRAIAAAITVADLDIGAGAELSVVLADDAFIQALNKTWRGKDQPTNVLSFPTGKPVLLGDIVVAYETSAREAGGEGKTLADHLTHLVAHGFLHLAGFDHEDEDAAETMENLETRILASLGIASPHAGCVFEEDQSTRP